MHPRFSVNRTSCPRPLSPCRVYDIGDSVRVRRVFWRETEACGGADALHLEVILSSFRGARRGGPCSGFWPFCGKEASTLLKFRFEAGVVSLSVCPLRCGVRGLPQTWATSSPVHSRFCGAWHPRVRGACHCACRRARPPGRYPRSLAIADILPNRIQIILIKRMSAWLDCICLRVLAQGLLTPGFPARRELNHWPQTGYHSPVTERINRCGTASPN